MIVGKALIAVALVGAAAPVLAHGPAAPAPAPTSVPEPSDAGLFLLGAVGVAVGRWMHARRAKKHRSDDRLD